MIKAIFQAKHIRIIQLFKQRLQNNAVRGSVSFAPLRKYDEDARISLINKCITLVEMEMLARGVR